MSEQAGPTVWSVLPAHGGGSEVVVKPENPADKVYNWGGPWDVMRAYLEKHPDAPPGTYTVIAMWGTRSQPFFSMQIFTASRGDWKFSGLPVPRSE